MDIAYVCCAWVLVVQGISGSRVIEAGERWNLRTHLHYRMCNFGAAHNQNFVQGTDKLRWIDIVNNNDSMNLNWGITEPDDPHLCCAVYGEKIMVQEEKGKNEILDVAPGEPTVLLSLLPWSHWFLALQGLTHDTHMQYPLGTMYSWSSFEACYAICIQTQIP